MNRVRVRRLLELKGAERRGSLIMNSIRAILDGKGLTTEPDFQSVWPDSLVVIKLRPGDGAAMEDATVLQIDGAQTAPCENLSSAPIDDQLAPELEYELSAQGESKAQGETLNSPVGDAGLVEVITKRDLEPFIRVSSVPSANNGLVTILPDDSLTKATTKMMFGNYSQLAIMQGDREVRGLLSWGSIAIRSLSDCAPTLVSDCRIDAQVIDSDASLYEALPVIAKYG